MKKIISIVILGVLLLGMAGGAVLAAVAEGGDCCPIRSIDCEPGLICVGAETNVAGNDCDVKGKCRVSMNVLKEFCTLNSGMSWKSGTVDGKDCKADDPCPLVDNNTVGPLLSGQNHQTDQWGMICLINTVNSVTNWIFYLLMVLVVVMVVIGGATYMMASGDPEKAGKGKSIIIYGIVGLVIALLARLIPSVVKLIVGM